MSPSPGGNLLARCGHCRHRIGHDTPDCPLHDFKRNHAAALFKDIPGKAKCLRLFTLFKATVSPSNTDAEIAAAIVAARAEVS